MIIMHPLMIKGYNEGIGQSVSISRTIWPFAFRIIPEVAFLNGSVNKIHELSTM